MRSIRVLPAPISRATASGAVVVGANLSLLALGKGKTTAELENEKPAQLRFHGRYLATAREEPPEFAAFAALDGKIVRRAGSALFVLNDDASIDYLDADGATDEGDGAALPLELTLSYAKSNFANAASVGSADRLRLPTAPADALHFELAVELLVDGAQEAPVDVSAILDVPLRALGSFEATLRDAAGEPLVDLPFELEACDGALVSGRTDGEGVVRVSPVMQGLCLLRLKAEVESDG